MMNPQMLVGKPLVVFADGEKRTIGAITGAKIVGDKLFIAAQIDIEAPEEITDLMEQP